MLKPALTYSVVQLAAPTAMTSLPAFAVAHPIALTEVLPEGQGAKPAPDKNTRAAYNTRRRPGGD